LGNTIVQLRDPFSSGSMVAEENPMATMSASNKLTQMNAPAAPAQIRLARRSPAYWRVTVDNLPINVMGPRGFHKPGDVENRLGYYLDQIAR
jgi:hypothetical protein